MCGRYVMSEEGKMVADFFHATKYPKSLKPRFNAAPTQKLPIILSEKPNEIILMEWGMKPVWWTQKGRQLINVREDNLREKPTFKKLFATQRCLVIADGYYEWKKDGKAKVPYLFRLSSHQLFAFPGIWEEEHPSDAPAHRAFSLITCEPNALAKKVHDRMPVILDRDHLSAWLDPTATRERLLDLLKPYPANRMEAHRVSTMVNSPAIDEPALVKTVR